MNILALDLATQLGFARKVKEKITHNSSGFHNRQWEGAGMRYLKFKKQLTIELDTHDYDMLVYEKVEAHGPGTYSHHIYGGWLAIMQALCEEYELPYDGLGVKEIKKFWTGKGTAKKKDMIDEAHKRGFWPDDDNDADALAILHLGLHKYEALF